MGSRQAESVRPCDRRSQAILKSHRTHKFRMVTFRASSEFLNFENPSTQSKVMYKFINNYKTFFYSKQISPSRNNFSYLQNINNPTGQRLFVRTEIILHDRHDSTERKYSTWKKLFYRRAIILQDKNHSTGQKSFYRTQIILHDINIIQEINHSTGQKSFYGRDIII